MKVTIIPIVIGAFGTVTKGLLRGLEELEVGSRVEIIWTTALLKTVRILRRVLETWGDLLMWKTPNNNNALQGLRETTGGIENQCKNHERPNYRIGLDTQKSPGILWRFTTTELLPVKAHQQILVRRRRGRRRRSVEFWPSTRPKMPF